MTGPAGTPGDATDQRWFRIARISLGAIVGAGIAMALSFEYIERGSHLVQAELEGLLLVGIVPTWMLWGAFATARFAECGRLEYGLPVVAVLLVIAAHLLVLQSFAWYLDILEPLAAAWVGWWFVGWSLDAALGLWLLWKSPAWLTRILRSDAGVDA